MSSVISRSSNLPRCAPVPSHTIYPQTSMASNVDVLQAGYPATESQLVSFFLSFLKLRWLMALCSEPACALIYLHGYCSYGESCRFAHPPGCKRGVPSGGTVPIVSYAPQVPASFPIGPTSNPTVKDLGSSSAGLSHGSSLVSLPAKPTEEPTKTVTNLAHRTAPCRHYTRNGGWCPVGEECNL